MGLDTSHDCWHGAYSAFSRWRQKLAEVAGYDVMPVTYNDGIARDTIMVDWGHLQHVLHGDWDAVPADPLLIIIAHSDCDGRIKHEHATALADRLTELLPLLDGDGGGHIGDYRTKTQQFIDGLRKAASAHEDVDFH